MSGHVVFIVKREINMKIYVSYTYTYMYIIYTHKMILNKCPLNAAILIDASLRSTF